MSTARQRARLLSAVKVAGAVTLFVLAAGPAHASGSGMPWEGPLQQIVDSITGPVAQGVGVLAIVLCGLGFAFSESGGGLKKLAFVGLSLSITFAAASFFLDFFGFAGGAVI